MACANVTEEIQTNNLTEKKCFISQRSLAIVFEMVKSDCKSSLQVEDFKMFCEYQRRSGDHCHYSTEFLDQLSSALRCPRELMNGGGGVNGTEDQKLCRGQMSLSSTS
jgi:hypothetical protein